MKKAFRIAGVALVVGVAVLAVVIAMQPSTFEVERSHTIAAPSDAIFPYVNDFHRWDAWSPWAKLDPKMKTTHSGAPRGKGAVYAWSGNDEVGKGRQTITKSVPNRLVEIRLEFLEPWQSTNTTTFELEPAGKGTRVTWSMRGTNDFVGKAFGLFMNMDALVGKDFARGLRNLDRRVRAASSVMASPK